MMTPCVYTRLMPSLICHMNTQVSLTGGIGVILYRYWFFTVAPAWLMKAIKKPVFFIIQTLRVPVGSGFKQQMCLVHLKLHLLFFFLSIHLLGWQAWGSVTCQGFNLTRSWTEPLQSLNWRKCNNMSPPNMSFFGILPGKLSTLTRQFYKMGLLITLSTFQE